MKILVTGAAGFIGANYVYSHLELHTDDEIVVLDVLNYAGDRGRLKQAEGKGVIFVEGSIEDKELVFKLFEDHGFDIVVNFAAETHVDRSIADAKPFVTSNLLGTQTLLDAAKEFNVKRFHQISTDEVYGDTSVDSELLFTETSPLKPSNPYSATKAASDLMCLAYFRTHGIPVTVSRCSNNYGPFQSIENLIPSFITKAKSDEALPLYGKGENVRDWLYVKDHCAAILLILEKGTPGEVYNIGGDNELSNIDVTKGILAALDKSEDLIAFVDDRPGHDRRYGVDFTKLKNELGWTPSTTFEDGMRETINWYSK